MIAAMGSPKSIFFSIFPFFGGGVNDRYIQFERSFFGCLVLYFESHFVLV